ncbi:MAG: hypothetical protein JSS38_13170 [Nitrospira sp.]|nr:hypothetical protein [Nitrospira sp.]MBS0155542.1 hypothetical protein [Nitrospira sp.]MBS0167806.1 hypothetical protein [Nitrospira sp.]
MLTAEVIDAVGGLIAHVKTYAMTLPSIVHLKAMPSGVKPSVEAIDNYEVIVSRVQRQSAGTPYRGLNESLICSLEAFEQGNLIGTVQVLLAVIDQLERMHRDQEIDVRPMDEKRLTEYRVALRKVLPGNRPELAETGGGL